MEFCQRDRFRQREIEIKIRVNDRECRVIDRYVELMRADDPAVNRARLSREIILKAALAEIKKHERRKTQRTTRVDFRAVAL